MSWWDAKHFTSLATQALKTAQKKIDKVLDIKEDDDLGKNNEEGDSFFNKWLSPDKLPSSDSTLIKKEIICSIRDQTLSGIQYDGHSTCDSKGVTEKKDFHVLHKEKPNVMGSSRSAFKKFKGQKVDSTTLNDEYDNFSATSLNVIPSNDDKVEKDREINQNENIPSDKMMDTTSPMFENSSSLFGLLATDEFSPGIGECTIKDGDHGPMNIISCDDALSNCWSEESLSHMVMAMDVESQDKTKISSYLSEDAEFKDVCCNALIEDISEKRCCIAEHITLEETFIQKVMVEDIPKEDCQGSLSNMESASVATLVTESSLENSTCASDDLSEGNKTLTGEEGNFLLSNFANMCESQIRTTSSSSLKIHEIGDKERLISSPEITQSPDVVQGMIEDAMNEEGYKETFEVEKFGNRDFSSLGEVQTVDKVNSEVSVPAESGQTSGHTSADEVDTTTSSDIEIISHMSTPSFFGSSWRQPAGEKHPVMASSGVPTYCNLSPSSKRMDIRAGSPAVTSHQRSDSGSSGQSLQSRNGEEFVSIDYANVRGGFVDNQQRRNPQSDETQCLAPLTSDDLLKKISELKEILEVRERKVLELSQENLDLRESNVILRNQLRHEESVNDVEKEDLKSLSDEFAKRIGESEKRFQVATREKEVLKRALVESENEKKSNAIMAEKIVKEKEQIIAELMLEGEKLSRQQLQLNTAVKKLRTKDKENECVIKELRSYVSEQKMEIERLEAILDSKLEAERKFIESINHINSILKTNEEEIVRLKNDLEDAQEKSKSFKLALDNSYKEISELHRARMTDVTEAQQVAASVEISAKEELLRILDEQKLNARKIENQFIIQIEDLQLSLSRMEKEYGRREDALRQEISDLQQRLQEAEERNQELTQSVSAATRPLLRQIENIQCTFAIQSNNFERVEKNLSDRLVDAQNQLMSSIEKERYANENLIELSSRIDSLDIQVSSLRQDKAKLQAELELEKSKTGTLEETRHMIIAQRDTVIRKLEEEIKDLKKEKILLTNQVDMEKMKADVEKKKNVVISDQLREKEIQLQSWSLKSTPTPQPSEDILRFTPSSTNTNEDSQERTSRSFCADGGGRLSIYDSLRGASGSTIIEHLQSQLKLRQGEISQLLSNISELERTKESLSKELVNMSMLNEELQNKLENHSEMEKQFEDVAERHNALLQMYGEKVEEAEELRMDLEDIKEIYKCQMDELLKLKSTHSKLTH